MRTITITFDDSNLTDTEVEYVFDNIDMRLLDLLPWTDGEQGEVLAPEYTVTLSD